MSYTHLTMGERKRVYDFLCTGSSSNNIAKELGRDKGTISREINRNSDSYGYLYHRDAHEAAKKRRIDKVQTKIGKDSKLKDFIIKKLGERLSPKMIAVQWGKENPGEKISKDTIYAFIYGEEGSAKKLYKLLVRAKKKRGLTPKTRKSKIKEAVSIHSRPEEINERSGPGHYEGDLIFNKGSMSKNILTMIDRYTRENFMVRNESKHTDVVIGSLIKYMKEKNINIKSVTFDNGSEFAGHKKLNELGIKTYFCDPGSPYQKGSIENLDSNPKRIIF